MIKKYSQLKQAKSSSGGYIFLSVKKEDAQAIHAAAKSLGLKDLIPPEDMHLTVVYDKNNPDIPIEIDKSLSFSGKVNTPLLLGSGEWEAIVLPLTECEELKEFHNSLLRKGFKHSYFNFTPHISIKYKPSKEDVQKARKELIPVLLEKGIESVTLVKPKQEAVK